MADKLRAALLLTFALCGTALGQLRLPALRSAAQYSAFHRGLSFLVVQDGRTLLEEYSGGATAEIELRIYSGTKAFWNLAALAAAQDSILDLDEPVANTITAWRKDAAKSRITIRQLLNFDSGLTPEFMLQQSEPGDRDAIAIHAPLLARPGAAFIYGPASLQVFHRVLKTKLHSESPMRYLERRVLGKLGLGAQRYLPDRAGNPLLASGFVLTARDWAKLGALVLHNGSPVISQQWLAQCWRGSAANPMFGFGWWNNRAAPSGREIDVERAIDAHWSASDWRNACLCRDAPRDLVACIGSGHQRLYVVPSLRLIVVRQGDGGSFSDGTFLRLLLHG
ncbi:MAG: beta-lactamase family protein [Verrucomicrobia bacterium]|nr:beta-lactamase family protein [Verrucomicrobiota bacterium]